MNPTAPDLTKLLNPEQLAACQLVPRPWAAVIAGAGSGKTRLMAARVVSRQCDQVDPDRQVIVTFTNRAADELRGRVQEYGGSLDCRHVGTLHSWCLRELRHHDPGIEQLQMVGDKPFDAIVKEEAKRTKWRGTLAEARALAGSPRRLAGQPRVVGAAILARCLREGILHPDLILGLAAGRIEDWQLPALEIYVDEYQDSSPVDEKIYQGAIEHHRARLFVVGDVRQSVYAFRGASPVLLEQAWKRSAEGDCRAELRTNYRSAPDIVQAGNLIARSMHLPDGSAADMVPARKSLRAGGSIHRRDFVTAEAEAEEIADWLKHQHQAASQAAQPTRWERFAILARYNQQVRQIAGVLQAHRIPVTCSAWEEDQGREWLNDEKAVELANLAADGDVDWPQVLLESGLPLAVQDALTPRLAAAELPEDVLAIFRGEVHHEAGRVFVGTVHAAKGLEWPTVWLAGADDQAFPEEEEPRRLAYVAVTRAREQLIITSASSRQAHTRLTNLQPTKTIITP